MFSSLSTGCLWSQKDSYPLLERVVPNWSRGCYSFRPAAVRIDNWWGKDVMQEKLYLSREVLSRSVLSGPRNEVEQEINRVLCMFPDDDVNRAAENCSTAEISSCCKEDRQILRVWSSGSSPSRGCLCSRCSLAGMHLVTRLTNSLLLCLIALYCQVCNRKCWESNYGTKDRLARRSCKQYLSVLRYAFRNPIKFNIFFS